MVDVIVFVVAAVIVLGGGLGVISLRNPVHAALSLIASFFGVAVLFILQEAHLLALVQVVVYAGAAGLVLGCPVGSRPRARPRRFRRSTSCRRSNDATSRRGHRRGDDLYTPHHHKGVGYLLAEAHQDIRQQQPPQ